MASFLVVRADDHLVAGVRWSGFTTTGADPAGVPILTASAQARLVVLFPPQHVGEESSPRNSAAPLPLPAGSTGGTVPGWRGVLSGGTRVVFAVAAGTRVSLTAEGILAAIAGSPLVTAAGVPGADETAIELPWRLLITPRGRSASGAVRGRHPTEPVVSEQVSGMWRTGLVDASSPTGTAGPDAGLTLRAPDEATAGTADPTFAPNNSLPLTRASRVRVVTETRNQPASVSRLELSALGGTLDAVGVWPNFEWEHHAVLGRDMRVRVVTKGVMYPLGHRAVFLEYSERVFDAGTAVLRSVFVLTIVEPVRRAPADGPVQRGFPLGDTEITTTSYPDLAPPDFAFTDLPGVGSKPTHCWPTILGDQNARVRFPIRAATSNGDVRFELPLLFVADLLPTVDSLASPELATRLAGDYGTHKAGLPGAVLDVTGSAGRADRATSDAHEVHSITVKGLKQLDLRDGYRAGLDQLEVALPALRVLRGDPRLSAVKFTEKYLRNAAEDVALQMLPAEVRDIDFSAAADKAGGLVAPKYATDAISRTLGPVSLAALPNPATGLIDPASLFPSDKASLLGFPLNKLLSQLKLPPEITAIPVPGSAPEIRMQWRNVALKTIGPFVATPQTRLDLDITAAANRNSTVCTVKEFALELPPGPKRILRVKFAELKFSQQDGNSPKVDVSGVKVEFLGELKLLEKLQNMVDLGAAGKLLDVRPSGVAVRYALPLPPVTAGAFVMRNMALSAGIDIPFNGDPFRVALGFASRANPFQLAVMMFGGGGYVEISLDRDGLQLFEASLEFGAFVAVDFVVASGEVHALGGVRFTLDRAGIVTLSGYLRIGGCIEVLGLISVSVELCLTMTYNSERNSLVGRATLVIEIDLTLWSESVELDSGEWVIAGGGARAHPLDELSRAADDEAALARWREYRKAFADESSDQIVAAPRSARAAGELPEHVRLLCHTEVPHKAGRVVWSPDDRWVAVGAGTLLNDPNGLSVLDAASGELRWRLDQHWCRDIAFSPDGQRVAISGTMGVEERHIRMLDAGTGQELWHTPGLGHLVFSPDSTLLGVTGFPPSGEAEQVAYVLDAETGDLLHSQGRCLAKPAFSSDSELTATGSPAVVHSRDGAIVWQVDEHDGFASASAFNTAEDAVIVASGRFGVITHYATRDMAELSQVAAADLTAASRFRESIRIGPDRSTVAFLGSGLFGLCSVVDGRTVFRHRVLRPATDHSVSFHPDGGQVAVNYLAPATPTEVGRPGLTVLDSATGTPAWSVATHAADVAFSHDGSRLVAAGVDSVRVYEVGRPAWASRDCGGRVTMVAVSAAEAGIAAAITAGDEPKLVVFRVATGEEMLARVHSGSIASVAVSPDGHSAATAGADGRCVVFDTITKGRWVARHGGPVNAVAFSPDGERLATAGNDRAARLFDRRLPAGADPDDHRPRWTAQHSHTVTHVAFGPDGAWVATAALDRKIRILSAETGDELHGFEHDARIRALSVGASGLLVSASDDGSASVIDAATGQRRHRIEHPGPQRVAALSADGTLLATAGTDAQVHIWRVDGPDAVLVRRFAVRAAVITLAFQGAGHQLAVATEHPIVTIVDAEGEAEVARLIHPGPVSHLAFGVDGALLATGCEDEHARVYVME
ncbi:MAG: WD40 repeat domain-containing protein [Actinophytocola sp.]|uniref:WD40 repeat domain-containing protein n=1 Tax=Actinophytocola sp. TaxID=1872138 RepID=UPI003D6B5EE2